MPPPDPKPLEKPDAATGNRTSFQDTAVVDTLFDFINAGGGIDGDVIAYIRTHQDAITIRSADVFKKNEKFSIFLRFPINN